MNYISLWAPLQRTFTILICFNVKRVTKKFLNVDLELKEKCFGLFVKDKNDRKTRLRNYFLSMIKHVIFKGRANKSNIRKEEISKVLISKCRKFIKEDLQNKFQFAKKNKNIRFFKEQFLIDEILGRFDGDVFIINL